MSTADPFPKLTILVIGAHPDDPEVWCGGTAVRYTAAGHRVVFAAMTNGATGHYEIGGVALARRRFAEAQKARNIGGIAEYRIFDHHTGELEPTVHYRKLVIRLIREVDPDLILTHRPYDYHPDHRYTSQLVLDASYVVTVPNMQPLSDIPSAGAKICYMYDKFTRPYPFTPDIVVPIDDVVEQKFAMLDCHESQMYEWIPFNRGILDTVPSDPKRRVEWLKDQRLPQFAHIAETYRDVLARHLGEEAAASVRYAEAFEGCEYGAGFDSEEGRSLFPFLFVRPSVDSTRSPRR